MSNVKNGVLIDDKVKQKIFPKIEKGKLITINAVLIHQTSSATAEQTFNAYEKGGHGAHFLIDKKGAIYQTANLTKKTYHVGKIKSKCYELDKCSKEELKAVTEILFEKSTSYSKRVKNLHSHEKAKEYPSRYPTNEDSIGIEIVGAYNSSKKEYETVSEAQNASLKWLLGEIYSHCTVTKADVYRHPDVSYKQSSEGKTATW